MLSASKNNILVENDMRKALYVMVFILEKISLLSGVTIEKAQVHSNALMMYCGIGMMHLPCIIPSLNTTHLRILHTHTV